MNRRFELTAVRKGGEVFPVEVAIAPISSDGAAMFAGYMRDITERRRSEAALAEYTQRPGGGARNAAAEQPAAGHAGRPAACHAATGRRCDPGEERLSRQHEPRAADAAERDHSLQRAAAGDRREDEGGEHAVDHRSAEDPVRGQAPARADQRHPRPLEDRGRQDDAVAWRRSTSAR